MNNNNTPPLLGEPHDPPPFNLHPIQVCAKSTVKIANYDGLHEVLIVPFTVTRTVESWLHFTANNHTANTTSGSGSNSYRRYGSSYSSYDDRDTDNNMMESDSDSFFDSSEEEDDDDDDGGGENHMESGSEDDDDHEMNDANNSSSSSNGQHHTQPQDASNNNNTSSTTTATTTRMKAYWIRELLVETQHGHVKTQVFRATVLYKSDLHWEVALSSPSSSNNNHNNEQQRGQQQQQQQQPQEVAIKRMSWECIQASRAHRISEDFIKEIAALQYLSSAINNNNSNSNNNNESDGSSSNNVVENGAKHQQQQQQQQSLSSLKQHHVMTADTIMANQSHVFIVMPYCSGGDIFQRVSQQPNFRFTESQSKYWFRQMLIGLRTLQSCQLCHRDISPENFIIMDDSLGSVTLVIDFGMCLRIPYSTTIEDGEEGSGTLNTTTRHLIKRQMACGKLPHMAPEIRYQRPFDGYAVDIWSTGTVLLFMLTGKRLDGPPRHPEHFFRLLDLRTEYGVSDDAMDLLRRIFRDRPEDRATLEEIWSHPFLQTL